MDGRVYNLVHSICSVVPRTLLLPSAEAENLHIAGPSSRFSIKATTKRIQVPQFPS